MNAKQWASAKSLLLKAADLRPEERVAYLDQQCPDVAVRAELLAMLAGPAGLSDVLAPPVLAAGTTLGGYVVEGLLGAGGMGQVYRATDPKLARRVAIKTLPPDVAHDSARLQRLEREAQLLASLNHPHIASIYGLEEADGVRFLVMELIEGRSLAERIAKGPLKPAEAQRIAIDVADALKTAHRAGIIHRDLKPGNIMLGPSGAKLLDFGLARRSADEPPEAGTASAGTAAGTIMGTLPYMAPEQVEGRPADARTDIFGFGCVLYEMLSGHAPFEGTTPSSLAAAILEHEPEPIVAGDLPAGTERLLARCLAKSPDDRWQTAADLVAELRWLADSAGSTTAVRARWSAARWLLAGSVSASILAATVWRLSTSAVSTEPALVVHSAIAVVPADEVTSGAVSRLWLPIPGGSRTALGWTPDGRAIVFTGRRGGVQQLYLRRLDSPDARPLPGTEGAFALCVSPDGRWVAFATWRAIKKVPLTGGPSIELASGLEWPAKGIVCAGGGVFFDKEGSGIWQLTGGVEKPVTHLAKGELAHTPSAVLPGDRAVLATIRKRLWTWGDEEIAAFDPASGQRTTLLGDAADGRYVASGHLIFMRRGTLMAVPFDVDRLAVTGAPVPLLEGVAQAVTAANGSDLTGEGQFAIAPGGSLAWIPGTAPQGEDGTVVRVDRHGAVSGKGSPIRTYDGIVRASLDGNRIVVGIGTLTEVGLWLYDVARGTLTPLSRHGEADVPLWSRDGTRILFTRLDEGRWTLRSVPVDGSAPPSVIATLLREFTLSSWTPAGDILGVSELKLFVSKSDRPGDPVPLLGTNGWEESPELSPDGKWLAYTLTDSGRREVYLQQYPIAGERVQVSIDGGINPVWNPNAHELFYVSLPDSTGRHRMMAVAFQPGTRPPIGVPRVLFEFDPARLVMYCMPVRCFDVSPDGRLFIAVQTHEPTPPPPVTHINLVQNWIEEVRAKAPAPK